MWPDTHRSARETAIVAALRRIIRAVDLHSRQLQDACGLTGPQLLLLREVERHGALTPAAAADRLHLSRATVTGIVARLHARGLVHREPSVTDGRSVELRVTALGAQVLAQAPSPLDRRFLAELERTSDADQLALLASLDRVASMMHAKELEAAPVLVAREEDLPSSDERTRPSEPDPLERTHTAAAARALDTTHDGHASGPAPNEDDSPDP
ncbi:MAG: MarR family transcriptional regulator [Planctomycetota bacterium]